ncbi:MAG: hypothetical protein IT342_02970 [Candidatus Melainabacteria bacterium]|nr:hypothetical protein [Candidatus Melainabacteria bacterium]
MDYDKALAAASRGDGLTVTQYLSELKTACEQEHELQLIYWYIRSGFLDADPDSVEFSSTLKSKPTPARTTSLLFSTSTFREYLPIVTIEDIPADCPVYC